MHTSIPQPEPDLTPAEIVERARRMIPVLRERATVRPTHYWVEIV